MARRRFDLSRAQWSRPESVAAPEPAPVPDTTEQGPVRSYRRQEHGDTDADGFRWLTPSPTAWPNVRPDGHNGRPPGPRTQVIGYSLAERRIRTVFRDGTQWQYSDVTPQEWERIRRTASTGRFIARVLDAKPYGPETFEAP